MLAWIEGWPAGRALAGRARRKRVVQSLRSRPRAAHWTPSVPCPRSLYDAGGAQIGARLYVFRGYHSLGEVNDQVFVFDMASER